MANEDRTYTEGELQERIRNAVYESTIPFKKKISTLGLRISQLEQASDTKDETIQMLAASVSQLSINR